MNDKIVKKIVRTLYDEGGFVAAQFNDPEMVVMYDELKHKEEWFRNLFSYHDCELRCDHECYYLTRQMPKSQFETRLKNHQLWVDVIDFMVSIVGKDAVGKTYKFTELLNLVEGGSNLPQKLRNLIQKNSDIKTDLKETNENLSTLISFLIKKQVLDKIDKKDEENEYVVTAVYNYYTQFVHNIILHNVDNNHDNPQF